MGGNIALELAARYPDLPAAVVLIDSVILPVETFLESLRPLAEELKGPNYLQALQRGAARLFLPTDSEEFKSEVLASIAKTPQHVLASSFRNHVTEYDASAAIEASRLPIAYIGAASPLADVNRFRQLRPDLIVGQTIGSGHFSPRLVPDQINAMLERFVEIYNQ
jgi:pimeloyl-ACP methyl ester carboxylesterase